MIARASILLPFKLSIRQGDQLDPIELDKPPYRVLVYAPMQAAINAEDLDPFSSMPLTRTFDNTMPAREPKPSPSIRMKGSPTIPASLLQIDFLKDDFDRRTSVQGKDNDERSDPPFRLVFEVANDFLNRYRVILRASHVKPLIPLRTSLRIEYLNENGEVLEPKPGFVRARFQATGSWSFAAIDQTIWSELWKAPQTFEPQAWDVLILDAEALLPEVGASLVLASASLEVFIAWCLDRLYQTKGIPSDLWDWMNNRGDFYKEPTISEKFDVLLRIVSGKSLKDDSTLWEAFRNLRNARNSLSHKGKAMIGDEVVTLERASILIGQARQIIDWVEQLLPEELRRRKLDTSNQVILEKPL